MSAPTITIASAIESGCCAQSIRPIADLLGLGVDDAITGDELVARALDRLHFCDCAWLAINIPRLSVEQILALAEVCDSGYRSWVAIEAKGLSTEQILALAEDCESTDRAWIAISARGLAAEQKIALTLSCDPVDRALVARRATDLTREQRAILREGGAR